MNLIRSVFNLHIVFSFIFIQILIQFENKLAAYKLIQEFSQLVELEL